MKGLLFGILLISLQGCASIADSTHDQQNLLYSLVLLTFLGSGMVFYIKRNPGTSLKYTAIWIAVFVLLILAYSFKEDFTSLSYRFKSTLFPRQGFSQQEGSVSFKLSEDGHFHILASVDGTSTAFMLDTGASDIVLSPQAATRAGFDLRRLHFSKTYYTANGVVQGAPVVIGTLKIGPIVLHDVPASVNGADMDQSLLGMRFLEELQGYAVEGETLTLYFR